MQKHCERFLKMTLEKPQNLKIADAFRSVNRTYISQTLVGNHQKSYEAACVFS